MPTEIINADPRFRRLERYSVYLRPDWLSPWTLQSQLFCNYCVWSAAPNVSSAEFEWRYGRGMRQGESHYDQIDYLHCNGWWVKIVIEQFDAEKNQLPDLIWMGIVEIDGDNPIGSQDSPAGVQKILAYGPERLLERVELDSTWCTNSLGVDYRLRRGIPFNEGIPAKPGSGLDKKKHKDRPGNRGYQLGGQGTWTFADDLSGADVGAWSIKDIVDYILAYHQPLDGNGNSRIKFDLGSSAGDYLPDWPTHEIKQHGKNLKQLLDELMDRRRLLGYTIETNANSNGFTVRPFNYLDQDIRIDSYTIRRNQNRYAIENFYSSISVGDTHIQESSTQSYDQVAAVGGRIICCGTISAKDGNLMPHWTDAQEDEYKTAATEQEGYEDLEEYEKAERNLVARTREELNLVYCAFGLPKTWNGSAGGGLGHEEELVDLFPYLHFPELANWESAWYYPALRFLPELPLKSQHDYSSYKIGYDQVSVDMGDAARWNYLPPLVLIRLTDTGETDHDRYADITKLGEASDIELVGDGSGRVVSFSVSILPDSPGLLLRQHGSNGHHALAAVDFTADEDLGEEPPVFNWRDNLVATVAMAADIHVEQRWPNAIFNVDAKRVLRINAEEYAGLHWVAPNTIVGLRYGYPVKTIDGGFIRDDRDFLQKIARIAYEWYGVRRQALRFSFVRAFRVLRVGDLITSIGEGETEEPIRSVVTEVRVDFARHENDIHRTTIQTQWGELDVLKLNS